MALQPYTVVGLIDNGDLLVAGVFDGHLSAADAVTGPAYTVDMQRWAGHFTVGSVAEAEAAAVATVEAATS